MKLILNKIYNQDCLTFMRKTASKSFDVIVTSPPYNINKDYSVYKDNKERNEYIKWMRKIARASYRVLKDDGSFFLNIGGKPSDPLLALDIVHKFAEVYKLQNVIHWIKHISIPQDLQSSGNSLNGDVSYGHFKPINSDLYLNQAQEYIFHFTKNGNVPLDKLSIGVPYQDKSNINRWSRKEDKRDRGNVWFIPYETRVGNYKNPMLHPAEFPVKLPYLCIKLNGIKQDMIVYDPFMGIGSTALASKSLGVSYVGTEIDLKYIEIAEKRIIGYTSQPNHGVSYNSEKEIKAQNTLPMNDSFSK